MIQEQFRDIVNDRLAELGWSRSDLARAAGVSRQVVTNYLNGNDPNPGPETMERFLRALGMSPVLTAIEMERPSKPPLQTAG